MHIQKLARLGAFAGIVWGASASPAVAAFSYYDTFFDTDWASVGVGGLRPTGEGELTLVGVNGTVTEAFLFWHGPTDSTDALANAIVTFNGTSITGTNIGISSDNNWGQLNSQAYRADVSALVAGNGTYTLDDFLKPGSINVNGASLYVFFDDGVADNNRDVVVFNGNDSNLASGFDLEGWDVQLNGITYTSGLASIQLTVSDGQNFGNDEAIFLNGNLLVPVGPTWNGTLGSAMFNNGSLWDQRVFDITSFLSPGNNDLALRTFEPLTDALSLVVAAIDLPSGAAPPVIVPPVMSPVPESGSFGVMAAAGLLGLVTLRRRSRSA